MPMIDQTHRIPFGSIPFATYFVQIDGHNIEINYLSNEVRIIDRNGNRITVIFSKSILQSFSIDDLMYMGAGKRYYVYPKGMNESNWLWAGDIVAVF
jgi:hypothetical protein